MRQEKRKWYWGTMAGAAAFAARAVARRCSRGKVKFGGAPRAVGSVRVQRWPSSEAGQW